MHTTPDQNHLVFLQNPGRPLLPGSLTERPQSCNHFAIVTRAADVVRTCIYTGEIVVD